MRSTLYKWRYAKIFWQFFHYVSLLIGADKENRTLVNRLETCSSTIELYPLGRQGGIRTHGTFRFAGLVIRCLRPLGHLSLHLHKYVYLCKVLIFICLVANLPDARSNAVEMIRVQFQLRRLFLDRFVPLGNCILLNHFYQFHSSN